MDHIDIEGGKILYEDEWYTAEELKEGIGKKEDICGLWLNKIYFYYTMQNELWDFFNIGYSLSILDRWDFKLESEWYFLQHENLRIRVLIPKIFFESHDRNEIESKLESLYLDSYIRSGQSHYIIIDNSGLNIETF